MLVAVVTVLALAQACVATDCDDGWIANGGSCYLLSHTGMSYSDAAAFCKQHGAHLVHVNDAHETNFLNGILYLMRDAIHWVGLSDDGHEDQWRWADDNTAPAYTNWHRHEPNGNHHINCAVFLQAFHYQWADEPCGVHYQPLCEKEVDSVNTGDLEVFG